MSVGEVEGVVMLCVAIGLVLLLGACGLELHNPEKKGRAAVVLLLGIVIAVLPAVEYALNIRVEQVEGEHVVAKSERVAENGLRAETKEEVGTTVLIRAGNVFVPMTIGGGTRTVYTVMVEREDGGVDTRTFSIGSLTACEDAATWDEARLDEVLTVERRATGTFFGVPVSGTLTSGHVSPSYHIHLPEGTLEGINSSEK